jgi:hypothetical protein
MRAPNHFSFSWIFPIVALTADAVVRGMAADLPVTSGLALWLSANSGVTTNGAGSVSAWLDQSGAGHSASQTSTGQQPTLASDASSGRATVHFGGNQFLSLTGQVISLQTFTIVAVARDQRTDANFRELISNWDSTSGNQGTSVFFGTTGLNPVRARLTDNFGGADQGQSGVGSITSPATLFIFTGVSGASSAAVYQNNALIASRSTSLTPRNLGGGYVVGRQGTGTFDEYWRGDISEMLAYDRELSGGELMQIWSYLAAKYLPGLPLIESIEFQGSAVLVSFRVGQPTTYALQARGDVASGPWSTIAQVPGSTSLTNVVITDPITDTIRFYRLRVGR